MVNRIRECVDDMAIRQNERREHPPEPHWFFLESFAEHLDDPFEVREAKERRYFYQNMPVFIHPGEAIVGQVDWDEPLASSIANTHIREDVLQRITLGGLQQDEKDRIMAMVERVRPFCFDIYGRAS